MRLRLSREGIRCLLMQSPGQGFLGSGETFQMKVRIGTITFHRDDLQVSTEVASIEPADREAIAQTGERRLKVTVIESSGSHPRRIGGCIQIGPDTRNVAAGNASTFIRNLEGQI